MRLGLSIGGRDRRTVGFVLHGPSTVGEMVSEYLAGGIDDPMCGIETLLKTFGDVRLSRVVSMIAMVWR